MSELQSGTIRERLARLEVLLCDHIKQHDRLTRWLLTISAGCVIGFVMSVLPSFLRWVAALS
jgi:hypothetical protein